MKNLFTCLSKKSLSNGNGSGMDREWIENGSVCSRKLFASIIFLLLLGVGNVWGTATSGTFYKITATGNLTTGYYIIAASNNASANNDYVAGSSINSNKRLEGVDINLSTSATTITNPDDALVFLITKTTVDKVDYYTFLNVKNNKYLYQSSTTSGKGMAWGDDATNFTLAGYNSSSPGGFKFTLNGASNNIFKYNASNHWFANYTGSYSVDMTPVRLYKAYKVTYNGNGNTGGSAPTDAVYYSGNGTTSVTTKTNTGSLVKTGYTFSGWNTQADGNGTDITAGNSFTITANTTLYAKWTAAASCSANPTIGAASLNGSISLSSFPVQTTGWTVGSNCEWSDFGFVWSSSVSTPTLESNGTASSGCTKIQKATSGTATSTSQSITGTFNTSTSYYVRGYGKNRYASGTYQYTSVLTITPRSVTFNLNGHGSSTPSVQYVNNGGYASDPSYSESVTGYTFGGWYKEAGCSNSWTFASDAVSGENKTLYAKWTANEYTITLNQDLTPTSAGTTSITATYNSNSNLTSAITTPTKTGWTFAGYFTAKNGGGTQIIGADGNVIASVSGYTDASKNWIGTSDVTLYAKWTCTVTWSVNGLTNVYSAQTLTYNGTSTKVASIPGPPSPASYCGDKFVGWTTEANVSQDDDDGLGLFTTVAGSPELKTVGNTTFYAVFADYDE